MKSKEFFQLLVADMTELEMTDLLESCNELIDRNKWIKLRDEVFTDIGRVEELEEENDNLRDENSDLERDKRLD